MYSLVRPKFSIPVHGEYRHLMAQRNLAISMGIPKENVILMRSGDVIEIGDEGYCVADHVQAGGILVDGLGIGDVGNIVLREQARTCTERYHYRGTDAGKIQQPALSRTGYCVPRFRLCA